MLSDRMFTIKIGSFIFTFRVGSRVTLTGSSDIF